MSYMRVTRGRVDPSRYEELNRAVPEIIAALGRLPGNQSYIAGGDRASGRTMAVSTWDTEEHARFTVDANPDVAARLERLGVQLEPSEFFEVTTT